jgi:hypothetical protein
VKTQQTVEFAIRGKVGGVQITPRTIGLSLFNQFNKEVEDFIKGTQKGLKLSDSTLEITDGSYKLRVALLAAVLTSLEPDLLRLKHEDSLGKIDPERADVVKRWQARIKAEQNTRTGELRDPKLIEFADYAPRYDEEALERFIEAGTQAWADVPDVVAWVRELRGGS